MNDNVLGLHHITAIAGEAQRNYDFYTKVLGLRFLKKTVNFDDPGTYHFYYGDEIGTPGTILTFFPWKNVLSGTSGSGMATTVNYTVPAGSLPFWKERLKAYGVKHIEEETVFEEEQLAFRDPDGLRLVLVIPKQEDNRKPWTTAEVGKKAAIRGFHSVTLTVANVGPTAKVLTEVFGYVLQKQEGSRHRYMTHAIDTANFIDLIEAPSLPQGRVAGGTVHHVAFRVKNESILMHFREKVLAKGLSITEKIDRNYFFSLYFREPGGVLFELATDNPGFAVDEDIENLGKELKLPSQYEPKRSEIENILPEVQWDD